MTKHIHTARSAAAAIAAAAALGSTGLAAQTAPTDAQPSLVQPAPAQPAALPTTNAQPLPVLTLPEPSSPSPELVVPEPEPSSAVLNEPVEEAAPPAPAPRAATTTTTRRSTTSQAEPAAAPADTSSDALPADTDTVAAEADPAFLPPIAEAPAVADTAIADDTDDGATNPMTPLGYLLGALAAIGLLVWFAFRRRKPKGRFAKTAAKPEAKAAPRAEKPAPMPEPALEPLVAEPVASKPNVSVGYVDTVSPMPTRRPATGAAVALPRQLPESYEERDALLKRMLDAEPDRANPFRGRKQRLKRARLILQSLGRSFEHTDPWIDLSQYPDVWPELARRKYPQAA